MDRLITFLWKEQTIRSDRNLVNIAVIGQKAEAWIFSLRLRIIVNFLGFPRHSQCIKQYLQAVVNVTTVLDYSSWHVAS